MRWFVALSVLMFSWGSVGFAAPDPSEGWELVANEDGVLVHAKEVEGSSVLAFRGEGLIKASLARTLSVVLDQSRNVEWTALMLEARYIKQLSPTKWHVYQHYDGPFPTTDRDFVMELEITLDQANRKSELVFRSVNVPGYPEFDCCVRADLVRSYFSFEEQSDGSTLLISEIHLDPKGWIPKWVVNLVQKDWEADNFAGLRKQVQKTDIKIHPLFAEW